MKVFGILTLFLIVSNIGNETINKNYIELDYAGPGLDKSIAPVIFHLDKFKNEDPYFIASVCQVSKCEFLSIKNVIEENENVSKIDTSDNGYYNFTIVSNGKKSLYVTNDKNKTKMVIDQIILQAPQNKKFQTLKPYLVQITKTIR